MNVAKRITKKAPAGTQFVQVPVYLELLKRIDADRKKIAAQDLNNCTRAKVINMIFREYYAAHPLPLAVNGTTPKPAARAKRRLKAEAVA